MKTVMIAAMILGIHIASFSQNTISEGNVEKAILSDEKGMVPVELHKIVVKNTGKKISYYLPDTNTDPRVKKLESDFVAYNISTDGEDYDYYTVSLQERKGILTATYESNGKLTHVEEKYFDIRLPMAITNAVYKEYPGWQIVKDKYTYSQKNGEMTKKEYSLKLKKENEIIKLKINPQGEIIVANTD